MLETIPNKVPDGPVKLYWAQQQTAAIKRKMQHLGFYIKVLKARQQKMACLILWSE